MHLLFNGRFWILLSNVAAYNNTGAAYKSSYFYCANAGKSPGGKTVSFLFCQHFHIRIICKWLVEWICLLIITEIASTSKAAWIFHWGRRNKVELFNIIKIDSACLVIRRSWFVLVPLCTRTSDISQTIQHTKDAKQCFDISDLRSKCKLFKLVSPMEAFWSMISGKFYRYVNVFQIIFLFEFKSYFVLHNENNP